MLPHSGQGAMWSGCLKEKHLWGNFKSYLSTWRQAHLWIFQIACIFYLVPLTIPRVRKATSCLKLQLDDG